MNGATLFFLFTCCLLWKIISLCFWDIPINTRFFEEALFITWSITLWILVEHHSWIVTSTAFLLLLLLRTASVKPRSTCERSKTCKSPTQEAISEEEGGRMVRLATWAGEGHKDLSSGGHRCTGHFKDAFQFFFYNTNLNFLSLFLLKTAQKLQLLPRTADHSMTQWRT